MLKIKQITFVLIFFLDLNFVFLFCLYQNDLFLAIGRKDFSISVRKGPDVLNHLHLHFVLVKNFSTFLGLSNVLFI